MAKLKWIGIVDDVAQYQQGELPTNAVKLKSPKNMVEMQIKAFHFLIPFILFLAVSMFCKVFFSENFLPKPLFIVLGCLCSFPLLLVHEILHGIVYPKSANVYIGIMPKSFTAVALASYPLSRKRFVLMCLLPFVLGIVPMFLFWILPSEYVGLNCFLWGVSTLGLISPYVDCYNVYQVMRQTTKDSMIQFYKDDLYSFENK
ncbi:MAG: DUF3267 domain-containing protein [Hominimerdicola sp.]